MVNLSDKEVIRSIRKGEIDNFRLIVKKYSQQMKNYVAKKIYNQADAEDIVQNSFIHFYQAINRFEADKPILPYLFEIVKNEMKMYYRSRKTSLPLNEELVTAPQFEISLPDYEIEGLLNGLLPEQKKALVLVSEGYSYQEVAKRLGKPLNNVRTLIHRARLKVNKLNAYAKV